jgi:hypothetical protein
MVYLTEGIFAILYFIISMLHLSDTTELAEKPIQIQRGTNLSCRDPSPVIGRSLETSLTPSTGKSDSFPISCKMFGTLHTPSPGRI